MNTVNLSTLAFALPTNLGSLVLFVISAVVIWAIIRFVFKLAHKVFTLGCAAVVIIGVLVIISHLVK
jgi:hypothetical protein